MKNSGYVAETPLLLATPEQLQKWHDILYRDTGIDVHKIYRNVSPAVLYEKALRYEPGTAITSSGALITSSGAKTGRSPKDKRIVVDAESQGNVWWGPVNIPMDEHVFMINRERAIDYLNTQPRIYIFDGYAGWNPKYQIKVRVICARAYHALFMQNMLIRPAERDLDTFGTPDFTILNAGDFPANKFTSGMSSNTSVAISFKAKELVILGTLYAGEMKKGIFTVMHYLMPKIGVLSLHSSANVALADAADVSLFFGLSGTGKTTLSTDSKRLLIGDDEHCWSNEGIFNIEGGCYAKCIGLEKKSEPEIFDAIRFGALLENVAYDTATRVVDYGDGKITENTRCAYPLEFITNTKIPATAGHPKNIIMLTCDAFGVLPPVSRLSHQQAMYHFLSGYTAKVAGTEDGVKEPTATFSSCFGEPFLVWHPMKYAQMLSARIQQTNCNVWLVNTGWIGGGYGVGKRIPIHHSRAIIDAIHSGELLRVEYDVYPVFGLSIPRTSTNIPSDFLNPSIAWKDKEAFSRQRSRVAQLFRENFEKFNSEADCKILAAEVGPRPEAL